MRHHATQQPGDGTRRLGTTRRETQSPCDTAARDAAARARPRRRETRNARVETARRTRWHGTRWHRGMSGGAGGRRGGARGSQRRGTPPHGTHTPTSMFYHTHTRRIHSMTPLFWPFTTPYISARCGGAPFHNPMAAPYKLFPYGSTLLVDSAWALPDTAATGTFTPTAHDHEKLAPPLPLSKFRNFTAPDSRRVPGALGGFLGPGIIHTRACSIAFTTAHDFCDFYSKGVVRWNTQLFDPQRQLRPSDEERPGFMMDTRFAGHPPLL